MEKLVIHGGRPLHGHVRVSSAKNAVLPIIVATLLPSTPASIIDAPNLDDVSTICSVLESLGVKVTKEDNVLTFDASMLDKTEASYELMSKMRASFLIMGPLLAKMGHAKIALPGGCMIGSRPIDQHIKGFKALGAEVDISYGKIHTKAEKLVGSHIYFDVVTVGATINLMLASCMAEGDTILENAAKEPHIVDVANFLNAMGANIKGAGTDVIRIKGVSRLHGTTYSIIPDQIEAGTFMFAAAATKGDITVRDVIPKHLESLSAKLLEIGCQVIEGDDSVRVIGSEELKSTNVKTLPYPGFPTDMQPQMAVVLALAHGTSMVTESIFENRFKYVDELNRMGCHIKVEGNTAYIEGVDKITGAQMSAPDLRAGAALVIAALSADGISEIEDIEYIQRGYEDFEGKLRGLGAMIERVDSEREALKARLKIG